MGQQIQRAGFSVPAVRLVEDSEERSVDGAKLLLEQRVVDVQEGVECKRRCIVCVSDGRCFWAGHAVRDERRCAGIERGDDSCGQDGVIDGGGEGEAKVTKGATAKAGSNRRSVGVQELVHTVQRGIYRLPVDWRDVRVF